MKAETEQMLEKVLRDKYQVTEFISKSNNWYTFSTNFLNTLEAGVKIRRTHEDIIKVSKNPTNNEDQADVSKLDLYINMFLNEISGSTDYYKLNSEMEELNRTKLNGMVAKVILRDDYLCLLSVLPLTYISEDGIWVCIEELLDVSTSSEVKDLVNRYKK